MSWTTSTLGLICDRVGGIIRTGPFGSQLHESDYSETGVPVVMPKDIVAGRVDDRTIARIGPDHVRRLSHHRLLYGDIVYGRRGDIGRRALITNREAGWLCGTGCLRISLGDTEIDPTYLFYFLGHPAVVEGVAKQAVGATMANLNTAILRSIPIRYPDLATQRRIASILSGYDELIENNRRRIGVLQEMVRRLFENWFVHVPLQGRTDAMISARLDTIANVIRGRSYRSADLVGDGGIPFVNLKCIQRDGGFRIDGLKRYCGQFKPAQAVRPGDIVMAVTDMTQERRIVARSAIVPRLPREFGVVSMDLVKIVPKPGVPPAFLYALLRWSGFADGVKQHANGANVLHLSPSLVEAAVVEIPASAVMAAFAKVAAPILENIALVEASDAPLRASRDLLLPRLMSGEIDVSATEEPLEAAAE